MTLTGGRGFCHSCCEDCARPSADRLLPTAVVPLPLPPASLVNWAADAPLALLPRVTKNARRPPSLGCIADRELGHQHICSISTWQAPYTRQTSCCSPTTRNDDDLQLHPAGVKHANLAGLLGSNAILLGSIAILRAAAATILAAATCAKLAAAAGRGAVPAPVPSLATPGTCSSARLMLE